MSNFYDRLKSNHIYTINDVDIVCKHYINKYDIVKSKSFNKETGKEEIVKALSTINNEEKINCFQFFLDKYIDVIKPYVIITLGSFASNMLFSVANNNTGNKFALMRDHGKIFKYKNIDVIPTYSISFLDNKNNKMTVDEITQLKYNFVTDLYNAFTLEKQINYKSGIGNIKLP